MSYRMLRIVLVFLTVYVCSACSNSEETQPNSSSKHNDGTNTQSVAERIKRPIVEAEAARTLSDEYNKKLETAIEDE